MVVKNLSIFAFLLASATVLSQSYAPPAGETGSTAIAADSELFINWATGVEIERGYINIDDPTAEDQGSSYASYGEASNAIGVATNSAVSLGDAGEAILTFENPIANAGGYDFAVFENSFSNTFLELAFVEVSSDGVNYFRFPSHSETQSQTQVGGFGDIDASYINNLAGKYEGLFGTPFDLDEVADNSLLDKNNITHVKIIDVVGSINPDYASYDAQGNIINDPFPTPFYSSGFDLDGIGVIHEQELNVDLIEKHYISVYPNPTSGFIKVKSRGGVDKVEIYSTSGKLVKKYVNLYEAERLDISSLPKGMYLVKINSEEKNSLFKIIKK
ncbi:T9SS type A sorting domain-containing protein [Mesonia sp. MT50]|uniref:T9SS type A sorting domain-containing protein n=1 Tax=Mesonia profundi TaxID=3070998 RepID=A0ABU1A4I3_9FLAO|nr:T9SS type A sorting domain-containing protein [Mesonia profundi]MDQ7917784.1 T9SS type A sorting domain-containing protein [Mesonia profundi]